MFVLIVSFKKLVLNHNTIVLNVPDLKPHGPQDQDPDPDQDQGSGAFCLQVRCLHVALQPGTFLQAAREPRPGHAEGGGLLPGGQPPVPQSGPVPVADVQSCLCDFCTLLGQFTQVSRLGFAGHGQGRGQHRGVDGQRRGASEVLSARPGRG